MIKKEDANEKNNNCFELISILIGCFQKNEGLLLLKVKEQKEDQELMKAINEGNVVGVIVALRKEANPNAEIRDKK